MPHSTPPDNTLVGLIAAHNRRDKTVHAVTTLISSGAAAGLRTRAVLVDDGSTDGTVAAVSATAGDSVDVITADGTWFWARSMAAAEAHALATRADNDLLLWLNDDVSLDPDAIGRLVAMSEAAPNAIVVGSTRDPATHAVSYGGLNRSGRHPLSFRLVQPRSDIPLEVEAFNGNIVLVPAKVAHIVGAIDGSYAHAWADIDYGWRARKAAVPLLLAPGTFGDCDRNPTRAFSSRRAEWAAFVGVKGGGNPRSTRRLLRKVAPLTWPFWWSSTYVLWWLRHLRRP